MAHPDSYTRKQQANLKISVEEKVAKALAIHNESKKKRKESKQRKKTYSEIMELMPKLAECFQFFIRVPNEWVPSSFNLDRQMRSFVDWCLSIYPAPYFMYEAFLPASDRLRQRPYRDQQHLHLFCYWFIQIVQGNSFIKEVKGHMTKKEANAFLRGPKNYTIVQNIWRAKCEVRGFPADMTDWLSRNAMSTNDWRSAWWISVLDFYSKFLSDLNMTTLQETMDYLLRVRNLDDGFSLKGRTLGSVTALSNQWHRLQQKARCGGNFDWPGMDVPNWKYTIKKTKERFEIVQLTTSGALYREGRRMKHCVYSYAGRCVNGRTAIFSLREFPADNPLVTIEVTDNQVYQMRGVMNGSPSRQYRSIIERWAIENKIIMSRWA